MAKPRDIHGVSGDQPFGVAAATVVRVRATELDAHLEGVLDTSDIERVHDARVATRRLRAVLEIFAPCFPRKDHRRVLRQVKRLADALGERRDPDVQLEDHLTVFEQAVAMADRPGVDALMETFRAEQAAGNEALAAALEEAAAFGLSERLQELADAAEERLKPPEPPRPRFPRELLPALLLPHGEDPLAEEPRKP